MQQTGLETKIIARRNPKSSSSEARNPCDGCNDRRFFDPLSAMKIVCHTDYKTTANIYTHVRDEMLRQATVNMGEVFGFREKG